MTPKGGVTVTPGQSLRDALKARPDFDLLHGRTPFSVILDPRLMHADRTLFDVIGFFGWPDNKCHESVRDLAVVVSSDKRQIQRSIARLINYGHAKRNKDGSIALTSPVFEKQTKISKLKRQANVCRNCNRRGAANKTDQCGYCNKQDQADREIAAFLDQEPWTTQSDTWKEIKSRSKSPRYSAAQIESAYVKWHRAQQRKIESA